MFLYYIFMEGSGEIDISLLVKENDSGRAVELFMTYFGLNDVFDGNLLIYRVSLDDIPMGSLGWEQKGGMEYIGKKTVSEWVSGKTREEDEDYAPCTKCGAAPGTPEYGTVGDGFDGLCPSCADKKEMRSQIAAAISIGEGSDFAITKDDRLIVKTSQDEVIDLGSATKERMKELADYLNRLAHLANDA
jgi:hypothetical protein